MSAGSVNQKKKIFFSFFGKVYVGGALQNKIQACDPDGFVGPGRGIPLSFKKKGFEGKT
jgi:hypothetical protein